MSANDALELAINAGAEDCVTTDLYHEINCKKEEFNSVREEIEKKIKDLSFAGLIWNPLSKVNLDKETFTKVINFLEQIEDDDDVQNVFTNFEVDENGDIIKLVPIEGGLRPAAEKLCREEILRRKFTPLGERVPPVSKGRVTFVVKAH